MEIEGKARNAPLWRGFVELSKCEFGGVFRLCKILRLILYDARMRCLREHESVLAVRKERHARRRKGESVCYMCIDRHLKHLILSQKLPTLGAYMNSIVGLDSPSVSSLYDAVSMFGRTNGYSKYRWRVVPVSIEDVPQALRVVRKRDAFEQITLLGPDECYVVTDEV